ncbi:TPA: hypothetical protein EYN98_24685 [Candidatus Poribacteria bacterium]|nr:hypothetical protein [Candidatus Poribacteria bacterium]HIN75807.1 hypothetical protein [Rhodospirillales bacterium]HIB88046.1 hypothetical protein [Candidatus Poribacteria bacterium]HIC01445.1 hypothetical protein [Candidatus Poribacteria bacterium]HIO37629.1 hypothetical protein [Rhodospirillales bacterium]
MKSGQLWFAIVGAAEEETVVPNRCWHRSEVGSRRQANHLMSHLNRSATKKGFDLGVDHTCTEEVIEPVIIEHLCNSASSSIIMQERDTR